MADVHQTGAAINRFRLVDPFKSSNGQMVTFQSVQRHTGLTHPF